MIQPEEIKRIVCAGLPDASVEVNDMTGGGDHWEIQVRSAAFAGKSRIEQHRLVFGLLEKEMGTERIHAVKLRTQPL